MNFIADLHIHSRFSMATSKALNISHLSLWAKRKGIQVLGTGDFTHPKWREELNRDLVLDEESGFYKSRLGGGGQNTLFCLQTEISSIYKKNGRTRKVHNLVFVPDLETADWLSRKLALIGNINSDGRPILGLDSRDLLELVLESSPRSVLIPAHIWTPWFSLFGSRSGFDSIEECYEDLTVHIFALETGLSSDPAMNRHLSALDKYALISNSDAHSGPNLGREANLFSGSPSYEAMFAALRRQARRESPQSEDCSFLGTCEFYPEEGKYHLDGHRACKVVLEPGESVKNNNICPVCGKPLTIGVLHRVMELADRDAPGNLQNEPPSRMLIPLPEVLGQILGQRAESRKVQDRYERCLKELGTEMSILCLLPEAQIRAYWEPLGEAISRLRTRQVHVHAGFDGQFGVIDIFTAEEKKDLHQGKIHSLPGLYTKPEGKPQKYAPEPMKRLRKEQDRPPHFSLSVSQDKAVKAGPHPVFILAGPGAGKTRCLVNRIAHLANIVPADRILALTYTRRAAEEMRSRLAPLFAPGIKQPFCDTLHALAWKILKEKYPLKLMNESQAEALFQEANPALSKKTARQAWAELNLMREKCLPLNKPLKESFDAYQSLKNSDPAMPNKDFCDLLEMLADEDLRGLWTHILVDEIQDLSPLQLRLIQKLCAEDGRGFFAIGDPDQSIYSFRGAASDILAYLHSLWPNLEINMLGESWRCAQSILNMARTVLGIKAQSPPLSSALSHSPLLRLYEFEDDKTEAFTIAKKISQLIGPGAHTLLDLNIKEESLAPSDIAILIRVKDQAQLFAKALAEQGIPFSAPTEEEFWHDESCIEFLNYARKLNTLPSPEELVRGADFTHLSKNKNFALLLNFWHKSGSWEQFWDDLTWMEEAEMLSSKSQSVRILTMHASKGLEFHTIFIPGLEKGCLPLEANFYKKDENRKVDDEEEKRLLYVALTRASHSVYISHAHKRLVYGRKVERNASPFLRIIEPYYKKHCISRHTRSKLARISLMDISQEK